MPVPPGSDPVRFANWVPNVSGGLVTSTIEQRTDWGYDYNRELAVLAENNGFDYALSQVHYMAGYGAEFQHESTSFLSNGRFAVNVVSGWFKGEFTALGEPWLEHDERYRRSEEFIRALRQIWTEDHTELAGDFHRLRDFSLKPRPLNTPERPHPEIFQGGNSTAARERSSPRPTPRPSKDSATPSSRPVRPPPTARACGRTPASRTWSSTTTASAPS